MTSEEWRPVKMEGIKENMYFVSSKSNLIGKLGRMSPGRAHRVGLVRKDGKTRKLYIHIISCTAFHDYSIHLKNFHGKSLPNS